MREICPTKEIIIVAIGFAISLIHPLVCAACFVLLLLFLRQGVTGCMKGLIIATTRGIISPAVGANVTGFASTVKWILIFVFSLYILFYRKREHHVYPQLRNRNALMVLLGLFAAYTIMASFITGSYPVVSTFKVLSYTIPFLAVVTGIGLTYQRVDWAYYCYLLLTALIIPSAGVIPFNRFKVVNDSFQGIINHPNLFGIFGAIYICFLLYSSYSTRHNTGLGWERIVLLGLTFVMIYLSESRTGMFSAAIILLIYFITMNSESKMKLFLGLAVFSVLVAFYFLINNNAYHELLDEINHFIMKRDTDNILDTREAMIEESMNKFHLNPSLGSGFGAPYVPWIKSFKFSMSMTYESGNLYATLLGDTGLWGFGLFVIYMGYILIKAKPKKWILFFAPVIISLGEMAFFSTNNIAIYYYIMFGLCLCGKKEEI